MQGYFAIATLLLLMVLVLSRVFLLRRMGIEAMHFGKLDKTDFLIPPFALFYFYIIFASALDWPKPGDELFGNEIIHWFGVVLCMLD